jgi:CheY-like chemotaxis protein
VRTAILTVSTSVSQRLSDDRSGPVLAGLAEEAGCEIVGVAGDERQAIAIARRAKPDLILADVDLGTGGDGIAAVRQIEHQAEVPSIVITANAEPIDHGIRRLVAVIGKPFEERKLKDSIKTAMALCPAWTGPGGTLV